VPRLTRAEAQSRNREQVLRAARQLFLRVGYHATTLAAVADAAGFSTGVVYSNFSGKPELALLVLRDIQAEQLGALHDVMAPAQDPSSLAQSLRGWAEEALDSGWPRLELEFALDARTSPAMVAALVDRQRAASDAVAAIIRDQLPELLADALPLPAIADAVIDLVIGFAIRRLINPAASFDGLERLLRDALALRD
jgi:AcrR family transcriptional regulator